jgi:hypothetical protein
MGPEGTLDPTRHKFIDPAVRRFETMADVEAVMWLQLAVELGVFPADNADRLLSNFEERILDSSRYVNEVGLSRLFGEFPLFAGNLLESGKLSLGAFVHPNQLSSELFEKTTLQMALHEVGREFRDGTLTIHTAMDPPEDWRRCLGHSLDPEVILQSEDLRDINLLMDRYLAFLDHAGNLREFWEHLDPTASGGYGVFELRRRARAMHNWRLNLSDNGVRGRFEDLTAALMRGLWQDAELAELGFDVANVRDRIEELCRSWSGDDTLILNVPFDESGGKKMRAA